MEGLGLRVRHRRGEPPYGLANRLMVRNDMTSVSQLLQAVGVDRRAREVWSELLAGRGLDVLASLSGLPVDAIGAGIATDLDGVVMLGDVPVGSAEGYHFGSAFGRVCPACLAGDLDRLDGPVDCRPHRRSWWDLVPFDACVGHGVPLLAACPACSRAVNRRSLWLVPSRCPCGHDVTIPARAVLDAGELAGEAYLAGRRAGLATGPAVLDAMPLDHASGLLFQVGRAAMHGLDPPARSSISAIGRIRAKAAGLAVLEDWPRGFHHLLDRLSDQAGPPARTNGPHARYGRLYYWIMCDPKCMRASALFEPLRAEFAAHYRARWPATGRRGVAGMGPGGDLVGLGALARSVGCTLDRAHSIAVDLKAIEAGRMSGSTPIAREYLERIRRILTEGIGAPEACSVLNVNHGMLKRLMRERVVERLAGGGRSTNVFDPERLRRLLGELRGSACTVDEAPAGTAGLVEAANRRNVSVRSLIRALRRGRLVPAGVLKDQVGLPAILVDLASVDGLRRDGPGDEQD